MSFVAGAASETAARAGRRQWLALAVLALPLLLVSMDVSVLYFAVPFISRDLAASATEQLWIFDIYGFVLAGLLVTMGALGDRVGRRRVLVYGAVAFGAASIAAAYARNPAELIAARAVLGIGGATLMPSTLGLIRIMFVDAGQRAKAIAVWSAVMTGGVALGPVLAGVLLEHFWWGSVFLVNLPAMALLVLLGPLLLPESRKRARQRFDLLGSVLSLCAVLPVIFGIKHVATDGLDVVAVVCIGAGLAMGGLFLRRQRRADEPMLDLALFADRGFGASLLVNAVAMFALVGNAVFMTQYLQLVLGMAPLRAALWSLLPSVAVAGAAPAATALSARHSRAAVIAGGLALGAAGFVLLTRVRPGSPLALVIVGAGVLAFGIVAVLTLVTDYAMSIVAPERAGAVSALVETTSEFGGALGIALLGSIGTAVYGSRLSAHLPRGLPDATVHAARQGLAGAVGAAPGLPAPVGARLLATAHNAFADGLDVASAVGAAVLVATAVIAWRLLRDAHATPGHGVPARETPAPEMPEPGQPLTSSQL